MEGNRKEKISDTFTETGSSIIDGVIGVAMLVVVTVFPLVYHHSYVDILETKYLCYWVCALGMVAVSLILGLILMGIDLKEFKGAHTKQLFAGLIPRGWRNSSLIPDAAVAVFWIAVVISTLQSDYLYESFWGNEGRYSGMYLLTLYVATYFLISRFWKLKGWYLQIFLITGMIINIIGITDYFQMDVLNFRGKIVPEQSTIFTSTIGNINTYTAYVGLVMGFAAAMFSVEKKVWKALWYYLCVAVSFMAIIMGCSDNAYLSIGALFGLLPFVLFRNKEGVKRYLILLATFFSVAQIIDIINQRYEDVVIGLDSLFGVIAGFSGLRNVVIELWIVVAVFWIGSFMLDKAHSDNGEVEHHKNSMPVLVYLWGLLMLLAIGIVCYMFYDANVAGNAEKYGAIRSYLVFDDRWGTSRGYIWKKAVEMYGNLSPMHKLFGYGPDTFGLLTNDEIKFEMVSATGLFFDSAHNSVLQYLLTIGPIGTAGYVIFLVSAVCYMLKSWKGNSYIFAAACAVTCYVMQSLVNIDLPIVTPMMWLLVSAGMAGCREKN